MRVPLGRGPAVPPVAGKGAGRRQGFDESWPGDERVALRFAAAEPGSLELIVRRFADPLFGLAARLAGPERGEAVVEEAFLRAVAARERYRGEPPLEKWLQGFVEESARGHRASAGDAAHGEFAPPF